MSNMPLIIVSTKPEIAVEHALSNAASLLTAKRKKLDDPKSFIHPDLIFIKGESSIGIEQVKQLIHHLSRKPYQADRIAAVIHPGNIMTKEAQNAMLKTLEEPPEFANIYLTTTHLSFLLPTIQSRSKIIFLEQKAEREDPIIPLDKLATMPIHERLELVDEWLKGEKNRSKAVALWIDQWILATGSAKPELIKRLIKAKKMLKANVTPQHVLDYIAIRCET